MVEERSPTTNRSLMWVLPFLLAVAAPPLLPVLGLISVVLSPFGLLIGWVKVLRDGGARSQVWVAFSFTLATVVAWALMTPGEVVFQPTA